MGETPGIFPWGLQSYDLPKRSVHTVLPLRQLASSRSAGLPKARHPPAPIRDENPKSPQKYPGLCHSDLTRQCKASLRLPTPLV